MDEMIVVNIHLTGDPGDRWILLRAEAESGIDYVLSADDARRIARELLAAADQVDAD